MNFYAYIPREDGSSPMGTENKILFELKTVRGAIRRCERVLGRTFVLWKYHNIFDNKTFAFVHGRNLTQTQWENATKERD